MVALHNSTWSSASRDGTLEIRLAGEIDHANADELLERLHLELADVPTDVVVIDLASVTFLDSSGLRLLLRAKSEIGARGAALFLREPGPQARRLFAVSGVADEFPLR